MTETQTPPEPQVAVPSGIDSPYGDVKFGGPDTMRLTIDAPRADVQAIRIADMRKGATYFALQHFIKCLANECRRNNWGINDADKLANFIAERCRPANEGRDDNDGRRVAGVRQDDQGTANERAARKRKQATPTSSGQVE